MSYYYGPTIVKDGLILCLDAANQKSYEGSGTTWYDLSPVKNNATLTNGPTFNRSLGKGCIEVDGSNDYVVTSNNLNITGNAARTFMIYLYFINAGVGWGNIYTTGNGDCSGLMFGLGVRPGGLVIWGGCYDIFTGLNLRTNAWNFICIRYDGNGNIYAKVNSSTYNESGRSYNTVNSHLFLGAETTNDIGGNFRSYVNGKYGLCSVYNRCLSDSEVLQNYNSTKGRYNL